MGNNPDPVKTMGRCCDVCNQKKVIPMRQKRFFSGLPTKKSGMNFIETLLRSPNVSASDKDKILSSNITYGELFELMNKEKGGK